VKNSLKGVRENSEKTTKGRKITLDGGCGVFPGKNGNEHTATLRRGGRKVADWEGFQGIKGGSQEDVIWKESRKGSD